MCVHWERKYRLTAFPPSLQPQMSLFFMWSVASQHHLVERTKVLEFLISLAGECLQLNNFSSLMQIMSAIQHGSISRFKMAWECVPKNVSDFYVLSCVIVECESTWYL